MPGLTPPAVMPIPDPASVPVPIPAPVVTPPVVVRPGDLILVRAIEWWDSGQLKRVIGGIALTAAPILYDLFSQNKLTWRSAVNALIGALFAWIGISRAKSPDVVTNVPALDKGNAAAFVPAKLISDLQKREAAGTAKVGA